MLVPPLVIIFNTIFAKLLVISWFISSPGNKPPSCCCCIDDSGNDHCFPDFNSYCSAYTDSDIHNRPKGAYGAESTSFTCTLFPAISCAGLQLAFCKSMGASLCVLSISCLYFLSAHQDELYVGSCKGHWWSPCTHYLSGRTILRPCYHLYVLVCGYTVSFQLWSSSTKWLQCRVLLIWSQAGKSKLWQLLWVQCPLHPSYWHCNSFPPIWLLLGNTILHRMLFDCNCWISCFILLGAWWNVGKHHTQALPWQITPVNCRVLTLEGTVFHTADCAAQCCYAAWRTVSYRGVLPEAFAALQSWICGSRFTGCIHRRVGAVYT